MAGKGGYRENAGRKSKADEEKANYIFRTALKRIYKKDDDDEAKIEFVKELVKSQRGQLFVAEHLFGKAPDTLNFSNNTPELDLSDLTDEEIVILSKMYERKSTNTDTESD